VHTLEEPLDRRQPVELNESQVVHGTSPLQVQIDFSDSILACDAATGSREVSSYSSTGGLHLDDMG
jgi:hypothetical protein